MAINLNGSDTSTYSSGASFAGEIQGGNAKQLFVQDTTGNIFLRDIGNATAQDWKIKLDSSGQAFFGSGNIAFNTDGSAGFGTGTIGTSGGVEKVDIHNGYGQIQVQSAAGGNAIYRGYNSDGVASFTVRGNGSADFVSGKAKFATDGNLELYNGSNQVVAISANDGSASFSDDKVVLSGDGSARFGNDINVVADSNAAGGYRHVLNTNGYYLQDSGGNTAIALASNGTGVFSGTITAANVTFALNPNDPTKVLDVKESIRTVQSALYRLKAAVLIPDQTVNDLRLKILEALENISEVDE